MPVRILNSRMEPPWQPAVWSSPDDLSGRSESETLREAAHGAPPPNEVELEAVLNTRAREAFEAGRREGEARGREVAMEEAEELKRRFRSVAEDLVNLRPKMLRNAESDVLQLSLAIARRILNREIHLDPEALLGIIKVSLNRLEAQETHCLRVHPVLHDSVKSTLRRADLLQSLTITPDSSLPQGGLVFETARGRLDASIESQLEEIGRGLADRIGLPEEAE